MSNGNPAQSDLAIGIRQPGDASITLQPSEHRRDIDGLRALAVVPVVLFHFRTGPLMGGFLGVDVFFVISGYLITGIIAREISAGTFSLLHFYERRARRILPALMAMIAVVLAASAWFHFPADFARVPPSALSALGFFANVSFWSQVGYFASEAATMPLLHTWSLGIEEQYYLAMPLLLLALARWAPRWRNVWLALITLVSLALCLWTGTWDPDAAFYLPHTRAWELLVGSLLACKAVPQVTARAMREAIAMAGLALVAIAVSCRAPDLAWPELWLLVPVLGTALLLHCAPGTLTGRMLSLPPLVGIGLISYSLYIWHWPISAFATYQLGYILPRELRLALIMSALLIAWLSWRWIEQPFRNPQILPRSRALALGAGMFAGVALLCAGMASLGGWATRFSADIVRIAAIADAAQPARDTCLVGMIGARPEGCVFGAAAAPSAIVWGDSHAPMFARALGELRARNGESIVLRAKTGCPPLPAAAIEEDEPDCAAFNANVLNQLRNNPAIRVVYLSANWSAQLEKYPDVPGQIDRTIAALQAAGKSVAVIGPVPQQPSDVPRLLMQLAQRGELPSAKGISEADYARQSGKFAAHSARWRTKGAIVIDPARALVEGGYTRILAQGESLYVDKGHLSMAGARAVLAADPGR